MKKSPSELALEELFASAADDTISIHEKRANRILIRAPDYSPFPLKTSDIMKEFSTDPTLPDKSLWLQYLYQNESNGSPTIDSQSSICVDSPTSGIDPKVVAANSGSSLEQSDEEDLDIEAGLCEQAITNNHVDIKRIRRMESNRKSARRSRQRKQAHLAELEQQAEQLRRENASLFKQLTNASQQLKDATTNHRVLKSDVEALRAKVKLAEDMVARGSLTSSLSHLIQNYLNAPRQDYMSGNNNNMNCGVSPLVSSDNSPYTGDLDQNADQLFGGINGVMSEGVNCMQEMWTWESHHIVPTP